MGDSTIDDLISGRVSVSEIPMIRVVCREGKIITLDHRRLFAFRTAFSMEVQIPMKMFYSDVLIDQYLPADYKLHNNVHMVRTTSNNRFSTSRSCGALGAVAH